MQRRSFLQFPALALGSRLRLLAETPMPMATLGKSGLKVSRFTLGGYHMRKRGEENAIRLIHRAMTAQATARTARPSARASGGRSC